MSIETPYYKSFSEQWLSGDIYYQKYEIKGAFVDACHHYWASSCEMTYNQLINRVNKRLIDDLIKIKVIKKQGENIYINFLNEQKEVFNKRRKVNSMNGKKGGLAKARNSLGINKREEKKREDFTNPALKVSKEIEEMYKNYKDANNK